MTSNPYIPYIVAAVVLGLVGAIIGAIVIFTKKDNINTKQVNENDEVES